MEDVFISCGVTQMPHVLDYNINVGIYASSNNVVFFAEKIEGHYGVKKIFNVHDSDLTCLKLVNNEKSILITGDKGGIVKVNEIIKRDTSIILIERLVFQDTKGFPVGFVYGYKSGEFVYILFSSHQGITYCYTINHKNYEVIQKQEIKYGRMITLCCSMIKANELILALSISNSTISLLVMNEDSGEFVEALSLTGHLDWIRDMSFRYFDDGKLLLASASQDTFVRLWNFELVNKHKMETDSEDILKIRELILNGRRSSWKVTVETILAGHEGWIYSIQWHPFKMALLTCSIDKSIMIWEPIDDRGIWLEEHRLGEIGGQAVGYYGAVFGRNGNEVIANSYYGGLYCWGMNEDEEWVSLKMPSGHSGSVTDVDWDPRTNFVITCSHDQTTRIFSIYNNEVIGELARPQIHGHNRTCLKMVSSNCFVSGAEEKIFRVFKAPKTFANSLASILNTDPEFLFDNYSDIKDFGAAVPSLGLSNKAIDEDTENMDTNNESKNPVSNTKDAFSAEMASFVSIPENLTELPTEDYLMQNSLWPETFKLYGHGYEVFAIDSSPDSTLIATSCKASHKMFAVIYIWNTTTWSKVAELEAHQLTVVQIKFSYSGKYLLSCSRDRTWSIFKKESEDGSKWSLICRPESNSPNNHTRIIWSCDWAPKDNYFVTVGRDKKLLIWKFDNEVVSFANSHTFLEPVTAVAICPSNSSIIIVGLESGRVEVLLYQNNSILSVLSNKLHGKTVRRIRFPRNRRTAFYPSSSRPIFASVGDDNLLRIISIHV
uniref:Elongator complex protein 2 n=1 Tax=Parastrongyloides trichosuri TaxID=131310 RepID=A0A0N4Z1M9_PARTI